jgi:hypothetical protein
VRRARETVIRDTPAFAAMSSIRNLFGVAGLFFTVLLYGAGLQYFCQNQNDKILC